MRIAAKAFAKINWSLDILSAREDGYHEMDMLMQRISLHDEIVFSSAPEPFPVHKRPCGALGREKSGVFGPPPP